MFTQWEIKDKNVLNVSDLSLRLCRRMERGMILVKLLSIDPEIHSATQPADSVLSGCQRTRIIILSQAKRLVEITARSVPASAGKKMAKNPLNFYYHSIVIIAQKGDIDEKFFHNTIFRCLHLDDVYRR